MRAFAKLLVPVILASLMFASPAEAHPGSGIVVDRNGNVFFVRFGSNAIMKLSREGRMSVLVDDERLRLPHHLVLGTDGALYAASDFDGKVWRVGADGTLREYFNSNRVPRPARRRSEVYVGFAGDPFTIDSAGNVVALATQLDSAIIRITPDGRVTPLAGHARFGGLHFSSMAWGPDGALYLTDGTRVWRIVGDSASPIVPRGAELSRAAGLSVDSAGNIYVADHLRRRIIRLAPDGSVNTPPRVTKLSLHGPTGVTVAGGAIYVLDNPQYGVAVWRVGADKTDRLHSWRAWQAYTSPALLILVTLLVAFQTLVRTPSGRIDWLVWTATAGTLIVLLYWVAREAFIFSFARHAILALFVLGALTSYRRSGRSSRASPV